MEITIKKNGKTITVTDDDAHTIDEALELSRQALVEFGFHVDAPLVVSEEHVI